jgi:mono/diheme cytochrome c family protein
VTHYTHTQLSTLIVPFTLALAGCGDGSAQGQPGGITTIHGAPTPMTGAPEATTYTVDGDVSAMASSGAVAAAGTTTGVYELSTKGPVRLEVVAASGEIPGETGHVRAMAPYSTTTRGVLVAAEKALFFTPGTALTGSPGSADLLPLGIAAMTARVVAGEGDGADETDLAIVGSSGAHELTKSGLVAWSVAGETGAPTAMLAQRDRLFIAYGGDLYEVDKATGTASRLLAEIGQVREMACGSLACDEGSVVYFASDAGLVERSGDGSYTLYPLAAEGQPGAPVETFALDALKQRLYALSGTSVLRVRPGALPEVAATVVAPGGPPRRMAVDKLGDLWIGAGAEVQRIETGEPIGFALDVKDIMTVHCADCHAAGKNGAPKRDFESYEAMKDLIGPVLARVTDGSMPPPGYEKPLPKEKIEILKAWATDTAP